jgi:transposase-like protein
MNTSMVEAPIGRRRRRHSAEFKASVVRACRQPGVSMAAVALANGLNATMLRKWVMNAEQASAPPMELAETAAESAFVPLSVQAAAVASADIRIEVQRGATRVTVSWPATAAASCAVILRDLLR